MFSLYNLQHQIYLGCKMRPAIILVFALLLQGCGHKGPLTLPASAPPSSQQGGQP